jgi:hypothetical protein
MTSKTFNIILGSVAAIGLGTGLFFIFRKPKLEREEAKKDKNDNDENNANNNSGNNDGKAKSAGIAACGQTLDFSLPTQKSPPSQPSTNKNSRGNSYMLGQNVIVLDGSNIQRMDSYGCQQGSVKLSVDTALGSIYYINKERAGGVQTLVIKAKSGFSYPFYLVHINNLK